MKPKTRERKELLPSVRLYREDLEKLLSMFQEYCETVTISDKNSFYDSYDDMEKHTGSKVRTLDIAGTKPNITLSLNEQFLQLSHLSKDLVLTKDEIEHAELLFLHVKDFLLSRRTLLARMTKIPVIVIISLSMVGILVLVNGHNLGNYLGVIEFACIAFAILIPIFGGMVLSGNFSYLTLNPQSSASSFWKRNRDDIIKDILKVLIGAIVGVVVGWLLHR